MGPVFFVNLGSLCRSMIGHELFGVFHGKFLCHIKFDLLEQYNGDSGTMPSLKYATGDELAHLILQKALHFLRAGLSP